GFLRQHVAGVESNRHANDRYASPAFTVVNGPSHGSGAPIFWQERGMNVDSSLRRHRQHVAGKDLTISSYDQQIGLKGSKPGDAFWRVNAVRLLDRDIVLYSDGLHAAAGL